MALFRASDSALAGLGFGQVLGNLFLRFLLRSDIPSRADKTVDFAGSISEQDNGTDYRNDGPLRIRSPSAGGFSTEWVRLTHCIIG